MASTGLASPKAVRGGGLDLLRFAASMFVVIYHFGDEAPIPLRDLHGFWERGYLATDFFLILSGFVLARAYGPSLLSGQLDPVRFWFKRLARSYPTHLITLGLLVVMVVGANMVGRPPNHPEHFPLDGIGHQVLLLHAFGLGGGQWNIPAWTLSALLICYAVMPWLWRAISRLSGPWLPIALALCLLIAGQTISLSLLDQSLFQLPYEFVMLRAFPLFLVGLLLARSVETGHWTRQNSHLMVATAAGLFAIDALQRGPDTLGLVAIVFLTLGCGSYQVIRPIPGAAWGAKVSFSLFMTHTLVGAIGFSALLPIARRLVPALNQGPLAWALWFGMLGAALIAADLYNRWIDAPIQRLIQRHWFSPTARPISARVQPNIKL